MQSKIDPTALEFDGRHFIDGAAGDHGDETITVIRPSDGVVAGNTFNASSDTVARAVNAASNAFRSSGWKEKAPRERAAVMRAWADLVDAERERIAAIEAVSSTRLVAQTRARDVPVCAELIRYYSEYIDKHEGVVTATDAGALSLILSEPIGVIAGISPWNFPLLNATMKIAPAIAAGNSIVFKPSELTPFSIVEIAKLATRAGLPDGILNIVQGFGQSTGSALVRHPLVSKVSFTGSTRTGADIVCEAARHGMKPVVMELGGKSPIVVFDDVPDLDYVADQAFRTFTGNAGQGCTAGTRLVVHESIADRLIEKIGALFKSVKPGPTWSTDTTLSPIINERQCARVEELLSGALRDGARVVAGGSRIASTGGGIFFQPTILDDVHKQSVAAQEEFFGPILSVQRFSDMQQAVELANNTIYGLAASVFTDNLNTALRVSRAIESGVVWINRHGRTADLSSPAGGYKGSGFGKEWGRPGLEEYLRHKAIWIDHGTVAR